VSRSVNALNRNALKKMLRRSVLIRTQIATAAGAYATRTVASRIHSALTANAKRYLAPVTCVCLQKGLQKGLPVLMIGYAFVMVHRLRIARAFNALTIMTTIVRAQLRYAMWQTTYAFNALQKNLTHVLAKLHSAMSWAIFANALPIPPTAAESAHSALTANAKTDQISVKNVSNKVSLSVSIHIPAYAIRIAHAKTIHLRDQVHQAVNALAQVNVHGCLGTDATKTVIACVLSIQASAWIEAIVEARTIFA